MSTLKIDARLIADYQPALLAYARRRVRDPDIAHDLVQDTWAAAIRAAPRYEGRASPKTWLTAILRRKIADHHRRKRPAVSFEEHLAPPTMPPSRERIDDLRAAEFVRDRLPELPTREREAVTLIDVRGVDREDAAGEMGVSRGALRVLLHRGRAKLKAALEEVLGVEGFGGPGGLTPA